MGQHVTTVSRSKRSDERAGTGEIGIRKCIKYSEPATNVVTTVPGEVGALRQPITLQNCLSPVNLQFRARGRTQASDQAPPERLLNSVTLYLG